MPKPLSQEDHFKINKMIQEGMAPKDVARLLGVCVRTVRRSIKKNQGTIFMSSPTEQYLGAVRADVAGGFVPQLHAVRDVSHQDRADADRRMRIARRKEVYRAWKKRNETARRSSATKTPRAAAVREAVAMNRTIVATTSVEQEERGQRPPHALDIGLEGFLGYDPSGAPIHKKIGRYGPYVQAGSGQSAKRSNIIRGIKFEDVDLKMAMVILTLPKVLGRDIEGKEIIVHAGHPIYGPYVSCGDIKKSCGKISPFDITLEQATELLSKVKAKAKPQRQKPKNQINAPYYPVRELVKAETYVEDVGGFDRAVELLYAYLGYKEEREKK